MRSVFLAAILFCSSLFAADKPPAYIWGQPGVWQPKTYSTPVRSGLFGRKRFVPTGPPQPYALVPGRIVFPQMVPPIVTYPPVGSPAVPTPGGTQP